MSILVINSGSTSLKYKLFSEAEKEIKHHEFIDITNHEQALKNALREIGDLSDIKAVGHRVVHGGDKFFKPSLVNEAILSKLKEFNDLAPLHNPYNLAGIKAASGFLPEIPQVAVFDTAFFVDLPEVAQFYAIPRKLSLEHKIRRYGFHGISHEFVTAEAACQLRKEKNKVNLITCHLGGGWSIAAIKKGKPVDTSMGWTPMEGLVMMTRSGDLDPGIVIELLKMSPSHLGDEKCQDVYNLLNHQSGIKGLVSGINNYQELLKEVSLGNQEAKLAFAIAIYRLLKYIGAYWAVLEGNVDAIVFTGAIGAGNPMTRNQVMDKLRFLSDVPVMAIKTNEELMIARRVREVVNPAP